MTSDYKLICEETPTEVTYRIDIGSDFKYGLKFKKLLDQPVELQEYHKRQARLAICRKIFQKHRIIVDNYQPSALELSGLSPKEYLASLSEHILDG